MEEALLVAVGYSDNSGTPDLLLLSLSSGGAFLLLHGIRRGDNPSFAYGDRKLYVGCENEASATIARYGVAGGSLCLEEEYVVPYGGLCHLLLKDGILLGSRYLDGAFFALDAGGGGIRWQYKNEQAGQPRAHWMQANGIQRLLAADWA